MARIYLLFFLFSPLFGFSQLSTIELEVRTVPKPSQPEASVESWNQSFPAFKQLPKESREYLYWINFCRSKPIKFWDSVIAPVLAQFPPLRTPEAVSLKADLYKVGPLPMFGLNESLINTAQNHALDITNKKAQPSHESTNGTSFNSRMAQAGIKYCAGENISLSSQGTLLAVILLYLDIGLPQLGHRKSLLNPGFQETGVGSAPMGKDKETFFLVQDLACPQK